MRTSTFSGPAGRLGAKSAGIHHAGILPAIVMTLLSAACRAAPIAVDPCLKDAAETWTRPPASWSEGATESCFAPLSTATNSSLRYPGYSNSPELSFLGFKVYEMQLKYEGPEMRGARLSLYNRGDAGELSRNVFTAQVAAVDRALTSWSGQRGSMLQAAKSDGNILSQSKHWVLTNQTAELRWSASQHALLGAASTNPAADSIKGFRSEYIQVLILPSFRGQNTSRAADGAASAMAGSAIRIRQNVRKQADGSVMIENLPMVDQGQRGYCVVATAERLLRYYGRSLDQDALAQMADTRTGGGTDATSMLSALNRVSLKCGVTVKTLVVFNLKTLLDLLDKYNLQARKEGRPIIKVAEDNPINVDEIYDRMDVGTLRRARCERGAAAFKNFTAEIIKSVDLGIPLAWSVRMGLVKESTQVRQAGGGHMRIILGYNKSSRTLIFSDSWGAGHENKPMSFEDAWTITTGLYSLNPRY